MPMLTTTKNSEGVKEIVFNQSQSLWDIQDQAYAVQAKCNDYTSQPVSSFQLDFIEETPVLGYFDIDGMFHGSTLSEHSLSQLCAVAGVPVGYIKRCRDNGKWGRDLAKDNLAKWLAHSDTESTLIREYGDDHIRGILSSRFACFDAPLITDALLDCLDNSNYTVVGSCINEERFHARIINNYPLTLPSDKDLFWGFCVDSSDVGRRSLSITLFIWKQVCTNGLVVPMSTSLMFAHVHRGMFTDFEEGIRNTLTNAAPIVKDTVGLISKANDMNLSLALGGYNMMAREKLINNLKNHCNLSDNGINEVLLLISSGVYEPTLWGLVNAVTQAAQGYSLERRIEIERGAGKLLLAA